MVHSGNKSNIEYTKVNGIMINIIFTAIGNMKKRWSFLKTFILYSTQNYSSIIIETKQPWAVLETAFNQSCCNWIAKKFFFWRGAFFYCFVALHWDCNLTNISLFSYFPSFLFHISLPFLSFFFSFPIFLMLLWYSYNIFYFLTASLSFHFAAYSNFE